MHSHSRPKSAGGLTSLLLEGGLILLKLFQSIWEKRGKNEIQGRLGFLKSNSFSLFNKVPSIDTFDKF